MRILGLDVGSKTIGVACSDALLLTAQAVGTLKRQSRRKDCLALADRCIVGGKPSHMNGDKSANTEKIEQFVEELKKTVPQTEIVWWDERLTTVMAQRQLMEAGVRREKRKAVVDTIAAVFILQNYLDAQGG